MKPGPVSTRLPPSRRVSVSVCVCVFVFVVGNSRVAVVAGVLLNKVQGFSLSLSLTQDKKVSLLIGFGGRVRDTLRIKNYYK